jgi:hypothetical protein
MSPEWREDWMGFAADPSPRHRAFTTSGRIGRIKAGSGFTAKVIRCAPTPANSVNLKLTADRPVRIS